MKDFLTYVLFTVIYRNTVYNIFQKNGKSYSITQCCAAVIKNNPLFWKLTIDFY